VTSPNLHIDELPDVASSHFLLAQYLPFIAELQSPPPGCLSGSCFAYRQNDAKCTARHLVCCVRCLCEPGLALLASYKFYKFYKWLALHGGVVLSLQGHNTRSCWISLESGQIWSPSLIDSLRHFCKPGVDLCQSQSQSSRISKISVHRVVTLLHQESLAPCHMPCRQDLLKLHLRLWKLRRLKRSCNKPGYLQLDLEVKSSCRTSSSLTLCIPLLSFDCHGVCYSAIHCAKICQVSTGLGYHSESRTDVQPLAYSIYSKRRIEIEDVCLQTCFARSNSQPPSHSVAEFAAATATLQTDYLSRDRFANI
jgi:hypothetical protein